MRLAVVRRTRESSRRRSPRRDASGAGAGSLFGAAPRAAIAASMSFSTIRPPGPVPVSEARSIWCSRARRRARGEAFTCSASSASAAASGRRTTVGRHDSRAASGRPSPRAAPEGTSAGRGAGLAGSGFLRLSAGGAGRDAPFPCSADARTAMTAPTGALSPSFTRTSERTPSSKASSSMFALSVSTSASTSPIATLSPGCFSQRRIFPSSIVSESFGMVTSGIDASGRDGSRSYGALARAPGRRRTNRRLLEPEEPAHGSDDAIRRRDHEGLQVGRVWHRHVDARQTVGRRVELVERLAHDERDHLRGHTGKRPAFLDDEAATRASHGVDDRLAVERPNGAEVEHFHLDAVAGELLGGLREACSILAHVTTVTSRPGRFTSASPSGTTCSPAGTSPLSAYITSLSTKTTGLSSRMAAFSSPLASAGVAGTTTFRPGTWA